MRLLWWCALHIISLAYGVILYAIIIVAKNLRCKRALNRNKENNLRRSSVFAHPTLFDLYAANRPENQMQPHGKHNFH